MSYKKITDLTKEMKPKTKKKQKLGGAKLSYEVFEIALESVNSAEIF